MSESEKRIGNIQWPSGSLSGHLFSAALEEDSKPVKRKKRLSKADMFDSRVLPEHWRPMDVQSAMVLVPVLQPFKMEALRQNKTLKLLISEVLFEYGLANGIITKEDLRK